MSVTVRVPTPLRRYTGGQAQVTAEGTTLTEIFDDLEARYAGLRERLLDEKGELRRFVNVFVNEEDIRFQNGLATAVKDGDEVSIVPAIAGG
jgi:MoaD family protein